MENRIVNVGFIGNGKSCNRYHAPFILNRPEKFKIKKIFTSKHSYGVWPLIEGTEYVFDINELLNDEEIELVIISTPTSSHYDLAKQVLNAGKNCVVEKPFTNNVEEAEELFALAKEKGLMLQGYQNRRFDSDMLTVKKVIESGKLGDLLELESHYDYYRPEVPEKIKEFSINTSYLYGHACHTLDQIISIFGKADSVHFDVRQLLGEGRMNDYFDIDLYYGTLKVSVKSSYFRVKSRAKFAIYGKKGAFIKESEDRQEEDLKHFYLPKDHADFGLDRPKEYGTLIYYDADNNYHEEKVVSEKGDYALYYDAVYETLVNHEKQLVKPEETIYLMSLLQEGIKQCR